ncbi:Glyoxalase/Bleomycin resistance protein/Dioxygenase superfamily protein [Meinhardsimonia xiamenensis]|jgi:catechol 2,3-dioxygenase-like lactoylglutathione lyase family enzyme|uniref:Glyoxalase/Bleomycin resistance protein/Dioxygenase superfamily protein n=1 Tax=Meinhardsimonia xiamenensis TaxID=990712 RepID=A0A1G9AP68_9RHOB|nr:VOC family protein [Meinhardsimonia xiamenensis]PRX35324.1 glyoxalase/bleomycin resistance protein/dioxygenase superfamily protein [Meinhardsimonia xiamenensis]SDK28370.1 Glyoxalase/Bleomycin resistance protein/Dioxygenase superfamily protein [Meinhardsimonia xiamenensis]
MPLERLDHVNIRTANLETMVEWYGRVLDMHPGPRPDFPFPGAWLYVGNQAVVHLVGVREQPQTREPRLEHFAITATGLREFVERLETEGVPYTLDRVPGMPIVQVNLADCDGNHIHVDFDALELEALEHARGPA